MDARHAHKPSLQLTAAEIEAEKETLFGADNLEESGAAKSLGRPRGRPPKPPVTITESPAGLGQPEATKGPAGSMNDTTAFWSFFRDWGIQVMTQEEAQTLANTCQTWIAALEMVATTCWDRLCKVLKMADDGRGQWVKQCSGNAGAAYKEVVKLYKDDIPRLLAEAKKTE